MRRESLQKPRGQRLHRSAEKARRQSTEVSISVRLRCEICMIRGTSHAKNQLFLREIRIPNLLDRPPFSRLRWPHVICEISMINNDVISTITVPNPGIRDRQAVRVLLNATGQAGKRGYSIDSIILTSARRIVVFYSPGFPSFILKQTL